MANKKNNDHQLTVEDMLTRERAIRRLVNDTEAKTKHLQVNIKNVGGVDPLGDHATLEITLSGGLYNYIASLCVIVWFPELLAANEDDGKYENYCGAFIDQLLFRIADQMFLRRPREGE